jgi:hypothetical protein
MKNLCCLLIVLLTGFSSCNQDPQSLTGNLVMGDTLLIRYHQTLTNGTDGISVLLDSVLNDSRCPTDVVCIWAGNAEARFVIKRGVEETKFNLNTTLRPRDTTINGYKITLLDLLPYPVSKHQIAPEEYYAHISVQRN